MENETLIHVRLCKAYAKNRNAIHRPDTLNKGEIRMVWKSKTHKSFRSSMQVKGNSKTNNNNYRRAAVCPMPP